VVPSPDSIPEESRGSPDHPHSPAGLVEGPGELCRNVEQPARDSAPPLATAAALEGRKATVASVLAKAGPGLRLNEHLDQEDGEAVFRYACKLGLEGIVSKRKGSPYCSGRSPDWHEEPGGAGGEARGGRGLEPTLKLAVRAAPISSRPKKEEPPGCAPA
jgi:hypothetical protein